MAYPQGTPRPAYPPSVAIYGDKTLYEKLGVIATGSAGKSLVEEFEIPIRSGKAWVVKKGQLFTLSTPRGPQVADLNLFSLHNPSEHLWAARTRQLHATHVTTGDRLWSNLPYLRPLATIVHDGMVVKDGEEGKGYGVDEVGGRCHDLLGTRCDPYVNALLSGSTSNHTCHSNLVRAVLPFGLTETHIHDVLNVFQVTGLNELGQYFMSACPATPASTITFFAETDLLVAVSACPGGDLSVFGWGEEKQREMEGTCRPLGAKIWNVDGEGTLREWGWEESRKVKYDGCHGLRGKEMSGELQ